MRIRNLGIFGVARRLSFTVIVILLLAGAGAVHAATCRVTTTGSAGNSGGSWSSPLNLQGALGDAACTEIWVAQGVYVPGTGRSASFQVDTGVKLYGGFAGTETSRNQRDPAGHVTVLSGDIDGNDVNDDGNFINETWTDIVGGNSYHVVSMTGGVTAPVGADTVLDGFTITGGDANGAGAAEDTGGGMFCNGNYSGQCSPSLSNLGFLGNHADRGGALFNSAYSGTSSPTMSNISFHGNRAEYAGGAMVNYGPSGGTSNPHISNTTFSDNSASAYGGAIFNQGYQGESSPEIINASFSGNSANSGGAIANFAQDGTSNPVLTNVSFHGNTAGSTGGAMHSIGTAGGSSSPELSNVILWGDSAVSGGAELSNASATPTIDHSVVQGGCPSGSACTNLLTDDPLLGPLQDNGGFTRTMLPGFDGSAIDSGTCATATDQRGLARPQGFGCDIGAVEAASPYCFVDASANGGNNGATWDDAYIDLQSALANASCVEIWVAQGVYKPGDDRGDSFRIRPGSAVFGGFIGTETSREQRDPVVHLTVLSGDIGNPGDNADNNYHVVFLDGTTGTPITSSTVIDGFTITGGNADQPNNLDGRGGGLYCLGSLAGNECSPTLRELVFSHNRADTGGGAMECYGVAGGICSPKLFDVAFHENSAEFTGGAMENNGAHGASRPSLTNVTFEGNTADNGGAMFNNGGSGISSPTLINVTFVDNGAAYGGAMYNAGYNGVSSPLLHYVTFSNNHATTGSGGAMYNDGFQGVSSPILRNVILWGDSAGSGGAEIANSSATPTIDHSVVQGGCPAGSTCTNLFTEDPLLGPLQDNGGFTRTMLPEFDGSAIDSGSCIFPTDQRGVARPQGPGCDIGAVESTSILCYVQSTAGGANDGTSWADAYVDLQSALADAVCAEIWVAGGVYVPGTARVDSFLIGRDVALYGGFAGTESLREQREPGVNATILSGDIDGNDVNDDGNFVNETAAEIVGDNSYHVVFIHGTGSTPIGPNTVLDGFTITGGNADGTDPHDKGGGVFCDGEGIDHECSPTLRNLGFSGNNAYLGGGLYNNGQAGGVGSPDLRNVTFLGNSGGSGGAMYNYDYVGVSSPTLGNVTFSGNSAAGVGGAMYNNGYAGISSPVLYNVTFRGNHADSSAGAIYNDARNNGLSSPLLSNVILWGDTAISGYPEIRNVAGDDSPGTAVPLIDHSIVQGSGGSGGNWDSALGTDAGGNQDANPHFGSLGDHGGWTATLLLGFGSAAIDTGTCTGAPSVDQRGVARPQGPGCDVGAVEMQLVSDRIFADGFE